MKCKFFKNNFYVCYTAILHSMHTHFHFLKWQRQEWQSLDIVSFDFPISFCRNRRLFTTKAWLDVSTQLTILLIVRHIAFRWTHPSSVYAKCRSTSTPRRCIFVQRPSCGRERVAASRLIDGHGLIDWILFYFVRRTFCDHKRNKKIVKFHVEQIRDLGTITRASN